MLSVRLSLPEDAIKLAPRLRQADLREIQAMSGLPPEVVLEAGRTEGVECFTACTEVAPVAMFGVGAGGTVWLLGSDEIVTYKTDMFRLTGPYLDLFHMHFPVLWNLVDARNAVHIRWLRRFGFSLINLHPSVGIEARPFYEFVRIPPNV